MRQLTLVEYVADRTVIEDHDLGQIRLNTAQILDVCAVSKGAMLSVVPAYKVLALLLQPVDDRIRILLD